MRVLLEHVQDQEAAQKYVCAICTDLLHQPVDLDCGHLFCLQCLQRWTQVTRKSKQTKHASCPVCKEQTRSNHWKCSGFVKLQMGNLTAACPLNCGSQLLINHIYGRHKHECPKRAVACRFCHQQVLQSTISEHETNVCGKRTTSCSVCQVVLPMDDMKNHQDASHPHGCGNCVACPNQCNEPNPILFSKLQEHLDICENHPIECKTCMCSTRRSKHYKHLQSIQHILTQDDRIVNLSELVDSLRDMVDTQGKVIRMLLHRFDKQSLNHT